MPRISKQELLRLQKTIGPDEAIGEKLGISRQAVHKMRQKYGIPSRWVNCHKRDAAIKSAYKRGTPVNALAEKYGISAVNVYRILKGSIVLKRQHAINASKNRKD